MERTHALGGLDAAESTRLLRFRDISKQTSTHFYIAAWGVWVIALLAFGVARQEVDTSGLLLSADPNLGGLATIIAALALLMAVLWIGALVRLARQHDWAWLVAVLILQLIGLGIIGMGAYAIAGPMDIDLSRREVT